MPIHHRYLEQIKANDPKLTEIHITSTYPALTSDDIKVLVDTILDSKNTTLKSLTLSDNEIDDAGAKYLSKLSSIRSLALDENQITDKGAAMLAKMPSLISLSIAGNNIGNAGFRNLIEKENLKWLAIDLNKIDDKGAELTLKNNRLTSLVLDGNPISEPLLNQVNEHIAANRTLSDQLLQAAEQGSKNLIASLLNQGAFINTLDKDNNTPLHLAAANGHNDVIEFLIKKGANISLINRDGKKPIDLAGSDACKASFEKDFTLSAKKRKGEMLDVVIEIELEQRINNIENELSRLKEILQRSKRLRSENTDETLNTSQTSFFISTNRIKS